jgi:hypothetical protein
VFPTLPDWRTDRIIPVKPRRKYPRDRKTKTRDGRIMNLRDGK